MVNTPDLREIFDPPNEIVQAALNGDLILFVGAGASIQLGLPSWSELALKVLGQLRNAELLNFSQINQLKDLDARKQLSIAYDIAEENNIKIDLRDQLTAENNGDSIYKAINDIGCPCVRQYIDGKKMMIFNPIPAPSDRLCRR